MSLLVWQLKAIYTALGIDAAELRFEELAEEWAYQQPEAIASCRDNWKDFIPFL